jgi:hypothetical protein
LSRDAAYIGSNLETNFSFNDLKMEALETSLPRIDASAANRVELPMMYLAGQHGTHQLAFCQRGTLVRAAAVVSVDLPGQLHKQNGAVAYANGLQLALPNVFDTTHLNKSLPAAWSR